MRVEGVVLTGPTPPLLQRYGAAVAIFYVVSLVAYDGHTSYLTKSPTDDIFTDSKQFIISPMPCEDDVMITFAYNTHTMTLRMKTLTKRIRKEF